MRFIARHRLVAIVLVLFVVAEASAQQAAPLQPGIPQQETNSTQQAVPQQQALPQQAVPQQTPQQLPQQQRAQQQPIVQGPDGFQLNQLQQTELDLVLDQWQKSSGNINIFWCPFQRWEYDVAFGPKFKGQDIPLNKNKGELSYHKPDKGSFEIKEINTFREDPVPPGQQPPATPKGDWVKQPQAIGEHWVCDGKSIYEYRQDQKQLVERPIPPQLQGQSIVDGPLPFFFGAEAAKLKQRYWMRVDHPANQDPGQIWIAAKPKTREQAADFVEIDVILDRVSMLPQFMQVWMPNGSHHVYVFDIKQAKVNSLFDRFQALFDRPRIPSGWKRVVENVPLNQAERPVEPPR